ncbi:NAD(P)H-dependent oxidoreductase [Candidatus Bathyarchaeota archaeon]|nr:NAD(P)H-dependent oxidoreductase [Candidatus Bathyarchaeota archaeon]
MKALVVYYSRSGVTRKAAEEIASRLHANLDEIKEQKDRSGIIEWLKAAREATQRQIPEIEPPKKEPDDYDHVIVGTPVWAFTMSSPVRAYLTRHRGLKSVSFFCTNEGMVGSTFKDMEAETGAKPAAMLNLLKKAVLSGDFTGKLDLFIEELRAKRPLQAP